MAGALSKPDVDKYQRLLARNKMTSDEALAARRRWKAVGRVAALTAKMNRSPFGLGAFPMSPASPMGRTSPDVEPTNLSVAKLSPDLSKLSPRLL